MTMTSGRVVVLWGAHRTAPSEAEKQPTSIDKGVQELSSLGINIYSIYPDSVYSALPKQIKSLLKGRGTRFLGALYFLISVKREDVIYTTDHKWSMLVSTLKSIKIIKNRFVFKWAGFDLILDNRRDFKTAMKMFLLREVVKFSDVIFFVSTHNLNLVAKLFDARQAKLQFWPTAVDTRFYREIAATPSHGTSGFVAVGSDRKRDWPIIIELARRGVDVTVLTDDPLAKKLIEAEGPNRPPSLRLEYDVGMRRSAQIMSEANALIIATLPNDRFSGSTTIGVAAALGKPLILDEPYDLAAYGLVPGLNCETFLRGDVEAMIRTIERIQDDPGHARWLSDNISAIADSLDIHHYADALSVAFRSNEMSRSFSPATQTVGTNPCP